MVEINQILTEICKKNSEYDIILDNLLGNNTEQKNELISELAISFIKNKDKIELAYKDKWFKYLFINAAKTQIQSSTSPFHRNCRQTISSELEINDATTIIDDDYDLQYKIMKEEQHEQLNIALFQVKCTWFEEQIFKSYFVENLTYRGIEEKYNIDHCLAYHTVKKVLNKIKKQIKNNNN
jgi:hypothetical protein